MSKKYLVTWAVVAQNDQIQPFLFYPLSIQDGMSKIYYSVDSSDKKMPTSIWPPLVKAKLACKSENECYSLPSFYPNFFTSDSFVPTCG